MYKFLREYGIGLSLLIHWLLYYFALFNNYMDWGFNGKISYSIQWGSLCFLGIGVLFTFAKCIDDCNLKYLWSCIFSFTLRGIIIVFKPWGFDNSSDTMIFCGLFMLGYFLIERSNKQTSDRYFKY